MGLQSDIFALDSFGTGGVICPMFSMSLMHSWSEAGIRMLVAMVGLLRIVIFGVVADGKCLRQDDRVQQ